MLSHDVVIIMYSASSVLLFFLFGHCIVVGLSPDIVVELYMFCGAHLCACCMGGDNSNLLLSSAGVAITVIVYR